MLQIFFQDSIHGYNQSIVNFVHDHRIKSTGIHESNNDIHFGEPDSVYHMNSEIKVQTFIQENINDCNQSNLYFVYDHLVMSSGLHETNITILTYSSLAVYIYMNSETKVQIFIGDNILGYDQSLVNFVNDHIIMSSGLHETNIMILTLASLLVYTINSEIKVQIFIQDNIHGCNQTNDNFVNGIQSCQLCYTKQIITILTLERLPLYGMNSETKEKIFIRDNIHGYNQGNISLATPILDCVCKLLTLLFENFFWLDISISSGSLSLVLDLSCSYFLLDYSLTTLVLLRS